MGGRRCTSPPRTSALTQWSNRLGILHAARSVWGLRRQWIAQLPGRRQTARGGAPADRIQRQPGPAGESLRATLTASAAASSRFGLARRRGGAAAARTQPEVTGLIERASSAARQWECRVGVAASHRIPPGRRHGIRTARSQPAQRVFVGEFLPASAPSPNRPIPASTR